MFCKNCGNELRDGSRFCDKCGVPVAQEENRDVLSSATKQRSRKKLLLIIAAVSACIVAAVVLGAVSGGETDYRGLRSRERIEKGVP